MGAQATIHRLKEYFHNAQAALDAASLIVSAKRLGEPDSNRALLDLPTRNGWIESEPGERLHTMAGPV